MSKLFPVIELPQDTELLQQLVNHYIESLNRSDYVTAWKYSRLFIALPLVPALLIKTWSGNKLILLAPVIIALIWGQYLIKDIKEFNTKTDGRIFQYARMVPILFLFICIQMALLAAFFLKKQWEYATQYATQYYILAMLGVLLITFLAFCLGYRRKYKKFIDIFLYQKQFDAGPAAGFSITGIIVYNMLSRIFTQEAIIYMLVITFWILAYYLASALIIFLQHDNIMQARATLQTQGVPLTEIDTKIPGHEKDVL